MATNIIYAAEIDQFALQTSVYLLNKILHQMLIPKESFIHTCPQRFSGFLMAIFIHSWIGVAALSSVGDVQIEGVVEIRGSEHATQETKIASFVGTLSGGESLERGGEGYKFAAHNAIHCAPLDVSHHFTLLIHYQIPPRQQPDNTYHSIHFFFTCILHFSLSQITMTYVQVIEKFIHQKEDNLIKIASVIRLRSTNISALLHVRYLEIGALLDRMSICLYKIIIVI